ncbi:hypothetical protein PR048_027582 [Dryococelus australis]|uniref:C2H2-type domain-containing protein n=1 Tax=Dryococelus australis TaxID=614101 RepID=A0ABQ9GGX1_9NEOP|nr:hypothetical protein PR048_027582 [Dryococelus australis]
MVPHQIDSSVKSKDKQIGISHQVLEGRTTRKGSSVPKIKEKSKLKTAAKDDKATLKSVDNIQVACWKCFRDLKDNEMCSCSVDFEGSVKTKKADRKVNISVSSNDVAPFIKTEVSVRNKRKRENEDFGNNNSKKVRDDVKKPVQKRRESVPLVSHVYDIRRTKRKRTITDYNQLLNDGLLLSPRADRGKKDVKSIPKNTPIKEASKTTAISKHSITMSAKRNSRKSTDRKLENQENVPQKTTALETSKLNAVHARDMQRKKASPKSTASKLSPKRRVPKKLQQHEISSEGDLVEEQVPPEKLNKYECSVCSTQFPSTVEGKFHEVAHTAREMKLIMYRYRSSDQSSSSKQSQKNARKTENDTEIGGITKEIKKVLQDVVSKVSEDPLNKIQNVNGHNITRTRTGRIVVSKLQIKKVSRVARNKGRRSAADILKSDETVRSIISDFESLEEKEEVEEEPSLTTVVEESGTPALGTMDVDERIRKNSSEEDLKENHNGPEVAVDEQVDHLTDDLNPRII